MKPFEQLMAWIILTSIYHIHFSI